MDAPDPTTPIHTRYGGPRTASGAAEFAAIVVAGFGLVTLCNAAVGVAAELGVGSTDVLATYSLATVGFASGLQLVAVALLLGPIDLVVAAGIHRLRVWAYWAGLAVLGLHAVLGLFANPLLTLVALFGAIVLAVQRRGFVTSFE